MGSCCSKNETDKVLCPNNASTSRTDPQTSSTTQQCPPMITPTLKGIVCPRSDHPSNSKDSNASTSAPKGTPLPTIQKVFARRTGGAKWPHLVHMHHSSLSSSSHLLVFRFLSFFLSYSYGAFQIHPLHVISYFSVFPFLSYQYAVYAASTTMDVNVVVCSVCFHVPFVMLYWYWREVLPVFVVYNPTCISFAFTLLLLQNLAFTRVSRTRPKHKWPHVKRSIKYWFGFS